MTSNLPWMSYFLYHLSFLLIHPLKYYLPIHSRSKKKLDNMKMFGKRPIHDSTASPSIVTDKSHDSFGKKRKLMSELEISVLR